VPLYVVHTFIYGYLKLRLVTRHHEDAEDKMKSQLLKNVGLKADKLSSFLPVEIKCCWLGGISFLS
jgi:hypothetical protein